MFQRLVPCIAINVQSMKLVMKRVSGGRKILLALCCRAKETSSQGRKHTILKAQNTFYPAVHRV